MWAEMSWKEILWFDLSSEFIIKLILMLFIQVLEDETQQLKIQVTTLESDKILLNSHLEEIIQRRDEEQTDDVRVMKATYERDILALKKKVGFSSRLHAALH